MWTIDPIDGTKGFLRGEQYAVCLSLIVDSIVQVGVIGCPNLPLDPTRPEAGTGSIFIAVRGQGAQQIPLSGSDTTPTALLIPPSTPDTFNFLESVEAAHSSHSFNDRVSSLLNVTRPPTRMDSQAKYGCLARGDGGAYLRMPTGVGYREKIWVCSNYTYIFLFVLMPSPGPRTWSTPHRRSRGYRLRLKRRATELWSWTNSRRKFRCDRSWQGRTRPTSRSGSNGPW